MRRLLRPSDEIICAPQLRYFDDSVHLEMEVPFKIYLRDPNSNSIPLIKDLYEGTERLDHAGSDPELGISMDLTGDGAGAEDGEEDLELGTCTRLASSAQNRSKSRSS